MKKKMRAYRRRKSGRYMDIGSSFDTMRATIPMLKWGERIPATQWLTSDGRWLR